jgi:hypothetical protein
MAALTLTIEPDEFTVIGGYAVQWTWTGYPGNTLWEWLQMLLVPLVFPTILLPFLLK